MYRRIKRKGLKVWKGKKIKFVRYGFIQGNKKPRIAGFLGKPLKRCEGGKVKAGGSSKSAAYLE